MSSASFPKPARGTPAYDIPHPSGDERYKMLDATMKRHKFSQDALIEVLHTTQELFGCLNPGLLHYVARGLKLPPSRVYGVATFYHLFTFSPKGKHSCVVCTGTACFVKGGEDLLHAVREHIRSLGLEDPSRLVSVSEARCLGACGLAPVVVLDGQVAGKVNTESLLHRLKAWTSHGS